MTHHTPDDGPPGKELPENPINTAVAPQFPGQTYRNKSASPNSDVSDSTPKKPVTERPNKEPSKSLAGTDPSAGPFLDLARLISNPFRPPPPGPPVVNPFIGPCLPPQPERGRRASRPRTTQGLSPPSRAPTRTSTAGGGPRIAHADHPAPRPSVSPAPRRPSARPLLEKEGPHQPAAAPRRPSARRSVVKEITPPTAKPSSDVAKVKVEKVQPAAPRGKPAAKKSVKRDVDIAGPAGHTRGRGKRVEFGFDDLERLGRRVREQRRAERRREKGKVEEGV